MKLTCNVCGRENGNCNRYLGRDGRTLTICPSCLVFGCDKVSKAARDAHKEGRLIVDNNKESKKKGGRK